MERRGCSNTAENREVNKGKDPTKFRDCGQHHIPPQTANYKLWGRVKGEAHRNNHPQVLHIKIINYQYKHGKSKQ